MISLRPVEEADLQKFYEHQIDPEAVAMVPWQPRDRETHFAQWRRIIADPTLIAFSVLVDGQLAGDIVSWPDDHGRKLVGYWIGREFWGRGIATEALKQLSRELSERPLFAWVATSNVGSQRVLEKAGFVRDETPPHSGEDDVEELLYRLG